MDQEQATQALREAMQSGDLGAAERAFAGGADPNHWEDYGRTSVWTAFAARPDLVDDPERAREQVRRLLQLGADPKTRPAGFALIQAAKLGLDTAVEAMLAAGCDPDFQDDDTGVTALHAAVVGRRVAVVRALLAHGARADRKNKRKKTAKDLAKGEILAILTASSPAKTGKSKPPAALVAFLKGPARRFEAPKCDLPTWTAAPLEFLKTASWAAIDEDLVGEFDRSEHPPTFWPLATLGGSSEFLVVDGANEALPVLVWSHGTGTFRRVVDSLDAFVAKIS